VITSEEASDLRKKHAAMLEAELAKVDEYVPKSDMLQGKWSDFVWPNSSEAEHNPATGVSQEKLKEVAKASVTLPEDFVSYRKCSALHAYRRRGLMVQNIHSRLKRHVSGRLKGLETKVDFATAEAMAFGSLMEEGYDIRISGQDVGRGTFSQR
jgi:probable 2-oxoglutarate dehydrogenase E1 component DHKTD1